MNILKAKRAINPSKINLSGEMLHFYFRAQSRPRHGPRPRSALRADPAGTRGMGEETETGGGVLRPAAALPGVPLRRPADTRGSCPPPPEHRAHGHRKGASEVACPRGKCHPRLKGEVKQPSPERVLEMPHFGRFSRAVRGDLPPAPPVPVAGGSPRPAERSGEEGRSLLWNRRVRRGGGSSAWKPRGLFLRLWGCGGRRALPGASQRAHARELVLSLTQPEHGLSTGCKA